MLTENFSKTTLTELVKFCRGVLLIMIFVKIVIRTSLTMSLTSDNRGVER